MLLTTSRDAVPGGRRSRTTGVLSTRGRALATVLVMVLVYATVAWLAVRADVPAAAPPVPPAPPGELSTVSEGERPSREPVAALPATGGPADAVTGEVVATRPGTDVQQADGTERAPGVSVAPVAGSRDVATPPTGGAPVGDADGPPADPPAGSPDGSSVVGPDGGTVKLTSDAGQAAVLTVPPGALTEPVRISMSATTDFSGPDLLSRPVAGVDLQPSGLVFAEPATLRLRVPGRHGDRPLLAVLWGEDPAAAAVVPWRPGTGGTVEIAVPHFSGAGVGTPSVLGCPQLTASHPETNQYKLIIGAYVEQLGAGADPASIEASLVATLHSGYGTAVAPFVDTADDVAELADAVKRVMEWSAMVQCLGLLDDEGLTTLRLAGQAALREAGTDLAERYLLPTCTALAPDIRDWVRVPVQLLGLFQTLGEEPSPAMAAVLAPATSPAHAPFCLRAVVHEVDAPEHIDVEDRFVEVTFAARLEVVAQGGDVTAGPQRVDLGAFAYEAVVTGGTVDGQQQVSGTTDAVGRRTVTIDRGPDEDSRDPQVGLRVDLVRALPGAVPPGLQDLDSPDRATATTFALDLRPEPSLTTVFASSTPSEVAGGATVTLCVTVTDEVEEPVSGATVTFQLDGPGSPATAEATTVDDGVACVDWTGADDLEDPAALHVRATATRGEVTSPEATADLTVQPGSPVPPDDLEEPEPVHVVPGFAGTLEQSSGGSTRLGADGRTTISTSYSSSTTVTVSREEVARAQAGEVVPIAVLTRSDRLRETFGDYGLPGTSQRCVVTTLESRAIAGTTCRRRSNLGPM